MYLPNWKLLISDILLFNKYLVSASYVLGPRDRIVGKTHKEVLPSWNIYSSSGEADNQHANK